MWKQCIGSALLAAAMVAPGAQAQSAWFFSYSGFESGGSFDPGLLAEGAFAGSDRNGDGAIEQSELDRFIWDGLWYELADGGYCYGGVYCSLSGFHYSAEGQLDFSFDWQYSDEMAFASGRTVAGAYIDSAGWAGGGESAGRLWRWTEQTRFTINPPPVPEPGQYLLLAAGMIAGAAWRAARRRA